MRLLSLCIYKNSSKRGWGGKYHSKSIKRTQHLTVPDSVLGYSEGAVTGDQDKADQGHLFLDYDSSVYSMI